jgi:hypothetical protein
MRLLLILLAVPIVTGVLPAQDTIRADSVSEPRKFDASYRDPHRAQLLGSIIPGSGHVYAGERLRGFADGVVALTGITLGALAYSSNPKPFCVTLNPDGCPPTSRGPLRVAGLVIVGMGIWTWISGARDAPHAAERANARHRAMLLTPIPLPERSAEFSKSGWSAGVAVR